MIYQYLICKEKNSSYFFCNHNSKIGAVVKHLMSKINKTKEIVVMYVLKMNKTKEIVVTYVLIPGILMFSSIFKYLITILLITIIIHSN